MSKDQSQRAAEGFNDYLGHILSEEQIEGLAQLIRNALKKEREEWEDVYCMSKAEHELKRLKEKPGTLSADLVRLARALSDKMHEVKESPQWKALWTLAYSHGNMYEGGPTYGEELSAVAAALKEIEK